MTRSLQSSPDPDATKRCTAASRWASGIAQIAIPSPAWQTIFGVVGAIAVSITAFVRLTGMAARGPAKQRLARG
ncbi:hypothetical protein EWH13_02120 [Bradyrhizobium elkanii]|nr:hypothetical protein EWH13_02120 [Bradyrhizobium elkanii]